METNSQELKSQNKINYREKNLEFIQRLKEKKQRELDEKNQSEKKQQMRREALKRKILDQAIKARENKLKELQNYDNNVEEIIRRNTRQNGNFESLPKENRNKSRTTSQKQQTTQEGMSEKKPYEQKYLLLLQSLNNTNKSKRESEEIEKKKKEEKISKLRDELGFGKIDSKVGFFRVRKESSQAENRNHNEECARSQSAQKFQSLIEIAQNELPKTNKHFKRKNEEHLEKIKRKRLENEQLKEEQKNKKEKLKEKLKDYVMYTVKKNVLDGLYDDQFQKKPKKPSKENQQQEKQEEQSSQDQKDNSSTQKKKPRKMRNFPHVTNLDEWKRKNRLENGEKVFIVTGGYPEFKKALRERGWVQNLDCHSPCFDMKFTLQGREIDYKNLLDFQMVNHYEKNGVITTKQGLSKTLRNSVWINDKSQDSFFPKCFDLNDQDDYSAFETHFKVCKALSILKIYADSSKTRKEEKIKQDQKLLQDLKMRTQIAIAVCLKNIEDLDDIIDKKKYPMIITDKQWEILASDELNEESLAKKKHEEWIKSIDCKFNNTTTKKKEKKEKKKVEGANEQEKQQQNVPEEQQTDELLQKVQEILQQYKKRFPHQYHLTGHNNIWILKPAGLSRGRGITCYNNFVQIQDHVKCKQSLWIAQKYIENPLVILKRKFDIRQWVLITDFNPLTIWMYDECYLRFSAIDYDAKEISNKFIHLTNNSIGAYYKDFDKSAIKGNMFFQEQFKNYLKQKEDYDVFEDKIRPQMKEIVKLSMLCALDGIQNRKNTHELFGYDFMIDDNYKVWLIEINSSPSMDYSTHVTTKLVKEVLHDTVKVIIDHADAPKKEKKGIDTGKFKRIYKGAQVSEKIACAGLSLCLQGIPMKKSKKATIKPHTFSLDSK